MKNLQSYTASEFLTTGSDNITAFLTLWTPN